MTKYCIENHDEPMPMTVCMYILYVCNVFTILYIHMYVCMDCSPCWAVRPLRVFLYIYIPYRSIHRRRLCPVGWCPSVGRLVVPFPFCHAITSRRTYNPERSVLATVKGQEMGSDDGGGSLVVGLHTPQQQRKSPSPTTFTTEPLSYYCAVKASSVPSSQSYFIRLSLSYSGRSGVIAARPGRWI